ncbi:MULTISPECIES: PaaI family thioesterase [Alteribacter]|uniref:Hotdog fold thioesterase n=1 Tax=Alteribacter keqinensis TaxID=2483800 RepID=A0A3M7TSK1_9BACI|nr:MULTISPECIES: hotdog fold thioesterase [Alteribacter]MBM7097489.1 hotdog fold thioesterase [Alteribacter salitolerans]RNA68576.1 hotdog fold thioesterase [Alteribacter keqinensis]
MSELTDRERHHQFKEDIVRALKKDTYAEHLGIELTDIGEGEAAAELLVKEHMLNAHGTLHGAVTFAIADFVFAAACNSHGRTAVALTNTISYMAAGKNGARLKASAKEIKKNYRTAWYKIDILSDDELIAAMEATAYRKNHYFVGEKE